MNRHAPAWYPARLAGALVGLALLVAISPGVGTESADFGWWDAWRARLGRAIPADELLDRSLADRDHDGAIDADELNRYAATARAIFEQRFPRTLLALQVGMTLALCGAVFQVLFRNALATPYTLGIAGGGSLGALLAIRWGWLTAVAGISSLACSAFAGALVVVGAVYLLARGARRLTSNELLLAGVTMGLFCSALMMFVTVISSERQTFQMVRWMMGALDPISTIEGAMMWPLLVPAWVFLIGCARSLNQYRLGDELAYSRGVPVERLQGLCVLACTIATAAVVAQCGPIGFVGLVVPHIVAILVGTDCRILLPVSAIAGGGFLIICDWASQLAMRAGGWAIGWQLGSATLPIGVVTALIGVPIFLFLLWKRRPTGSSPGH